MCHAWRGYELYVDLVAAASARKFRQGEILRCHLVVVRSSLMVLMVPATISGTREDARGGFRWQADLLTLNIAHP